MRLFNYIKSVALASVIATSVGCTNQLDLEPIGAANGESIWGTASGSEQLLSGTYSRLRKIMSNEQPFHLFADLPSQALFKHNHWIGNYGQTGAFNGAYFCSWWCDWTPWFQVVTSANTLLVHIDDVPANEFDIDAAEGLKKRNKIKAEAHFLYSLAYFNLVRLYGDVPFVKEAFESVDQALEDGATIGRRQSPEEEILEYLLLRLDAAIVNLDYTPVGDPGFAVRADKAAALQLKAHVAAWLAHDYEEVKPERARELLEIADACLVKVLAESGRDFADYSNDAEVLALLKGESKESIFELQFSVDKNESCYVGNGDWGIHGGSYYDQDSKDININVTNIMGVSKDLASQLYNEKDLRTKIFFLNWGNDGSDSNAPCVIKRYGAGKQEDPQNPGRYFADANISIFRLTETRLLRAEIQYKLGNYGIARYIINENRDRAKIGRFNGSDEELYGEIWKERARELPGEGHSYYDRIRMNYWEGCSWWNEERAQKDGEYLPVLNKLFSSNRALVQNRYWAGRSQG